MKKNSLFFLVIAIFFSVTMVEKAKAATEITANITSPTTWDKDGSPYLVRNSIDVNSKLTIKPGVIVKFEYSRISSANARLIIKNEFDAIGTDEEKIIFTSIRNDAAGGDDNNDGSSTKPGWYDWNGIWVIKSSYVTRMEHVSISYADTGLSYKSDYYNNPNYTGLILKNSEIINNYEGLNLYDVEPFITSNVIKLNFTGIKAYASSSNRIPTFRNNSITENNTGLDSRAPYGTASATVDAKYNWWGDESGPYFKSNYSGNDNLFGMGNKILGDSVMFSPWLKQDQHSSVERKPLILIPGIGASVNWDIMIGGIFSDNWTLYDHTYDGAIQAFENLGYEEGKDFFICYYDWRKNNAESAEKYLKPLIDKAKERSGSQIVDVVAHSMGGLVARNYVQSDNYANDIDNLILIATPNAGSSDIYIAWEGGRIPSKWDNSLSINAYLWYMDVKKRTLNNYETIHKYIPSVEELMPLYDYVYDKNNDEGIKSYSDMNEKNTLLESLNQNIDKLSDRVKLTVIAGNNQKTLNIIPTVSVPEENPLWLDGKPDPLDPEKDNTEGDGRVLFFSAWLTQTPYRYSLNYSHSEIVSQSERLVADKILERLDTIYPAPDVFDEMGFWFASPVDIEIKAPGGKTISKDTNDIPLANYSSESKPDGFKMVVIPNPAKGDYEISIKGNGNGEYHIGSEYVDYTGKKQDYSSTIQGEIKTGEKREYKVSYDPKSEQPVTDIKPKDSTPPIITASATTEPNANGWYSNDVTIHFTAEDSESGIEGENQKDVVLSGEGKDQSVTKTFTDKAGNTASKTFSGINIDKTAPEAKLIFNSLNQKLDIVGTDNLSENVSVETKEQEIAESSRQEGRKSIFWFFQWFQREKEKKIFVTATLTDEAGHKTELVWERKKNKDRRINLAMSSISYDGEKTTISEGGLQYKWMQDSRKKKYFLFASHINTDSMSVESHYFPNKNQTWLMEKPKELADDDSDDNAQQRPVWKKLSGMIIPSLATEKGKLKIAY